MRHRTPLQSLAGVRYHSRRRRRHKTRKGPTVSVASSDNPVPSSYASPSPMGFCRVAYVYTHENKIPVGGVTALACPDHEDWGKKCTYIIAADDVALPRHKIYIVLWRNGIRQSSVDCVAPMDRRSFHATLLSLLLFRRPFLMHLVDVFRQNLAWILLLNT